MDGVLGFSLSFSTDHFSKKSIDQFSKLFKDNIFRIIQISMLKNKLLTYLRRRKTKMDFEWMNFKENRIPVRESEV